MDRFESMRALLAAVEAGSLSAAARKNRVPLATISRRVTELERHLHTQLLKRTSRKLELTDAGRAYHAACRNILEQLTEAERGAKGEYSVPRGQLVITAPIVFGRLYVLPVVVEFLGAYPEIQVQLALTDRIASLEEEHLDVAIRIGELPDSSLVGVRLGSVSLVVCGSPDYFALRGKPKQPTELTTHDCIAFTALSAREIWAFQSGQRRIEVPIRPRLTVNTAEAVIDAAVAGLGVVRVLSYQSKHAERAGSLVRVLHRFESAPMPVHLVHSHQSRSPLKIRAFIDYATPRLKAALSPQAVQ